MSNRDLCNIIVSMMFKKVARSYKHNWIQWKHSGFFPSLSGTVKRTRSQFGPDLHNFPADPFTIELKFHITNQNIAKMF